MKKMLLPKVKKLIEDINNTYGANTLVVASKAIGLKYYRVSSGSIGLDLGMGGGFCTGRIHLIIGKESTGKTTLCLLHIAYIHAKYPDAVCAFVDGEQTFDVKLAIALGVDMDRLILVNPDSLEQAGDVVQELLESGALRSLVIDSWASLIPTAEYEADMGDNQMGKNALGKNKMMRKIIGATKKDLLSDKPSCIIIITNHVTVNLGVTWGNKEIDPGGSAKNFFTSIKIRLARTAWIKKTIKGVEKVVGASVKWDVAKNKTHAPKKEGDYDYYFITTKNKALGIDTMKELKVLAKKNKLISPSLKDSVFEKTYGHKLKRKVLIEKIRRAELETDKGADKGRTVKKRAKLKARKKGRKKTK